VYNNDVVKRAVTGQTQAWVTNKTYKNSILKKVFAKTFPVNQETIFSQKVFGLAEEPFSNS
jgi:hypothetical protein